MLGIWELHPHPNVSSWGACLKGKDDNPKFALTYTRMRQMIMKNVFVYEFFQVGKDPKIIIILLDNPNSDSQGLVNILYNVDKLIDEMNLPTNIDVGFNLENIGVVIGKNINATFIVVESELHLKSKMVTSQSIEVTNVANFVMEKKPKNV